MKEKKTKRRLWRGLATTTTSVLALSLSASMIIDTFRTDIDKFLGTQSTQMVTENQSEDDYAFHSDYSSTTELLDAIEDLGERMNEEGSVLLKNENNALPLSEEETQKVTLLGFSSYYPVQGGDFGSTLSVNTGTDADTVDFVQALTAKGYALNPTVSDLYDTLKDEYQSDLISMWGTSEPVNRITAPSIDGTFKSAELSTDTMDATDSTWRDSMNDYNVMIVTLARAAGENKNYMPGEAGVDSEQNLNQADPLGLSDTERAIINAAVEAKASNGGKVIVILNNASAMEIEEIKDNTGVDAILQVGLPGGYGFYGVADVLSGAANPSGHLPDTYAVDNSASPAAQNYGNFAWTNADSAYSINSELVEAESIYTGYKYYETRYADVVMGQGNASDSVGSSTGGAWSYDDEVSYPFGYGLSYTTFEQTLDSLSVNLAERTVTAEVTVTNTGDVAGKDVVQLYVSVPYTDYDRENLVEKAGIQLLDYEKTDELQPGESVTITIEADAQDMTSWDSTASNEAGTTGNYILDAGNYYFTVGNGSHEAMNNVLAAQGYAEADGMTDAGNAANVQTWTLDAMDTTSFAYTENGTAVENQLQDMDLNYYMPGTVTYLTRNDWSGTWPQTYSDLTATDEMIQIMQNDTYEITAQGDPDSITWGADNGLTLAELKGADFDDEQWDSLMDQMNLEDAMIRTGFGGTSTKAIESISSPEVIQNDGPNGINSYTLGQYANTDENSADPYKVSADDPNLNYKFGTMCNETVIASTFSKEMAAEYGAVIGNYSIWSNLTIFWGAGTNLHRTPYNARNHEYYSEDAVLTAYQAASYIAAGKEYGVIIAPKHYAFNDTEINRSGIATFMTEQKARENELRGVQASIEDAQALGVMTTFNRIGCYAGNAHYGLLINILRNEWGFKGLMSEDFIQDANYSVLKEAVHCGVTMTCNTGDSTMEAVSAKWPYWTVDSVSQDATMMQDLKNVMKWQYYAIANSNAMDGLNETSRIVEVRTWYDNALTGVQIVFAVLTIAAIAMYIRSLKKEK
ncbi:beta-glucosidase-related glycosidase [Lachnoclostridium sp. An169]|uniref:beta-glucosidase n=1 Tax=Lachnoclostridium sp. An169 TaxID=1965569 RepID=UPI000B3A15B5|nr:glycoside hydrolase family 3 C-terminal domain-containing protein [Lachnoclostridium sp. An169]OUP85112.1 beta-glucosidase-related glycosidase [Lachnoclostridium sp. An169]